MQAVMRISPHAQGGTRLTNSMITAIGGVPFAAVRRLSVLLGEAGKAMAPPPGMGAGPWLVQPVSSSSWSTAGTTMTSDTGLCVGPGRSISSSLNVKISVGCSCICRLTS